MAYAGVVISKRNKILLQLRDNNAKTKNPLCWGIFGGKIEKGETPKQAARRELKEELGLGKEKLEPLLKIKFRGEEKHIFRINLPKNISKLQLKEGKLMNLFSKQEILKLKNTVPGLKRLVQNFL